MGETIRLIACYSCKCCKENQINDETIYNFKALEKYFGTEFIITSAYRCKKHNKEVGGATKSHHKIGNAIDFTHPDKDMLDEVGVWMEDQWDGGTKYYKDKKFIHMDIGPKRRW